MYLVNKSIDFKKSEDGNRKKLIKLLDIKGQEKLEKRPHLVESSGS
jgi:hypothetical protein